MKRVFVSCAPGLENALSVELKSLGFRDFRILAGGAVIECNKCVGDVADGIRLHSGVASHVLERLVEDVKITKLKELEARARAWPWDEWLRGISDRHRIKFVVASHRSQLWHQGAIAERLARACGGVTRATDALHTLVARVDRDQFTLSLNKCSEPCYRRGYRQQSGKAPLREDIARALVLLSAWDPKQEVLLDPFCGSGTIAIEASLLANGVPPGSLRFGKVVGAAPFSRSGSFPVHASDRDAGAIKCATENAARCGDLISVVVEQCAFSAHPLLAPDSTKGVVVVCNPPYGIRLRTDVSLYQKLGQLIRQQPKTRRLVFICSDPKLARATCLDLEKLFLCSAGGSTVAAYTTRRHT